MASFHKGKLTLSALLQAAYIRVPRAARQRVKDAGLPFRDGLHAASHALLNVVPLYMMCNSTDMAAECDNPYDTRFRPERLLLYDKHPGGIGIAAQVRHNWTLPCSGELHDCLFCGHPMSNFFAVLFEHFADRWHFVVASSGCHGSLQASLGTTSPKGISYDMIFNIIDCCAF